VTTTLQPRLYSSCTDFRKR